MRVREIAKVEIDLGFTCFYHVIILIGSRADDFTIELLRKCDSNDENKKSENRILPYHSPASKNTILLRHKDNFLLESSFKGENGPDSYPGLS